MIDGAALGIAGLINLVRDHALGEQRIKGFNRLGGQMAGFMHRTGEKPRIKQVQNRVFNPADILVNIHPIIGLGGVCWGFGMGRGKTRVIPRTIHKRVHRIGFAPRGRATRGAGTIAPCRVAIQRISWDVKGDIIGQLNGQVFLFLCYHAAGIAMHHRNRTAPIALARNAPIAQAVIGDTPPNPDGFAMRNRGGNRIIPRLQLRTRKAANITHSF